MMHKLVNLLKPSNVITEQEFANDNWQDEVRKQKKKDELMKCMNMKYKVIGREKSLKAVECSSVLDKEEQK